MKSTRSAIACTSERMWVETMTVLVPLNFRTWSRNLPTGLRSQQPMPAARDHWRIWKRSLELARAGSI